LFLLKLSRDTSTCVHRCRTSFGVFSHASLSVIFPVLLAFLALWASLMFLTHSSSFMPRAQSNAARSSGTLLGCAGGDDGVAAGETAAALAAACALVALAAAAAAGGVGGGERSWRGRFIGYDVLLRSSQTM